MPPWFETCLIWASLLLAALSLLSTSIFPLTPDRWVFEAGYACVPDGEDLRLFPQRQRFGQFVWWSLGFGLCCFGLACLTGVPALAGSLDGSELDRWYEWLGLGALGLLTLGLGVLSGWFGAKLMRARWFAGPLRETRFYWLDGERRIDVATTRLLRKPMLTTIARRELDHLMVASRQSLDAGVVGGSLLKIRYDLVQLVLVFRDRQPIDLMRRINDGPGARHTVSMIASWCNVETRELDGLPPVTPFNFDRH